MGRLLVLAAIGLVVASAIAGSANSFRVVAWGPASFTKQVDIEAPRLDARVRIAPAALEKKSQGGPVTAFVELTGAGEIGEVVAGAIRLCVGRGSCGSRGVPAIGKVRTGDADADGNPDLQVTFDRKAVIALLKDFTAPASVTLSVSGPAGSYWFSGSDTIRLVRSDPKSPPTREPDATRTPGARIPPSKTPKPAPPRATP